MPEVLERTSRDFPENTALFYMGKCISCRELRRRANIFANALSDLDVGPGDKVGMLLPNIPQVKKGYYNKPEEIAAVLKEGWLYLRDIGKMDEDGYLTIVDRKKDMIVAGGYNTYPKEIDAVLMGHAKVLEACTIGVPDTYRSETVKADVVPARGQEPTETEIRTYCRNLLAAYKMDS